MEKLFDEQWYDRVQEITRPYNRARTHAQKIQLQGYRKLMEHEVGNLLEGKLIIVRDIKLEKGWFRKPIIRAVNADIKQIIKP